MSSTLETAGSAGSATSADLLLTWFDRHRRDLPWRRSKDPYRIWLSEVMLQQTRVETVLPYFERFLTLFPTVDALAAAPLDDVLAAWSGLGYYRRARQLHAAAARVVAEGGFPRTPAELLELPGIGEYTAAAIASIAYGVVVPVMDGNVERVTARLLALEEDPKRRGPRAELMAAAAELLDPGRPGDSNQALMELGATLCSPQRPKCLLCPLRTRCAAAKSAEPERYPLPRQRRALERLRLLVALVAGAMGEEESVLLFRRPEGEGLLAGTWELPWIDLTGAAESPELLESPEPARRLAEKYGGRWELAAPVAIVRHGITYRDLTVEVFPATWGGAAVAGLRTGTKRPSGEYAEAPSILDSEVREAIDCGWFTGAGRRNLPMSSLVDKVLRAAREGSTGPPAGSGGGARGRRRR